MKKEIKMDWEQYEEEASQNFTRGLLSGYLHVLRAIRSMEKGDLSFIEGDECTNFNQIVSILKNYITHSNEA